MDTEFLRKSSVGSFSRVPFFNNDLRCTNTRAIQHKIEPAITAIIAPIKLDCDHVSAFVEADDEVEARIGVAVGTNGDVRICNLEIVNEFEVAL